MTTLVNIAIVDDEEIFLQNTMWLLDKYRAEHNILMHIDTFSSGSEFIPAAKDSAFDLVFLGIIMPETDGMETARQLRAISPSTSIVFLTSSPEYALESYSVKAFNYLLKPVSYDALSGVMNDYFSQIEDEQKGIIFKAALGYQKIPFSQIEYFEAQNKQTFVHLIGGEAVSVTDTFSSFEERLAATDSFYKCHRSYIISLPHVVQFTANNISMKSGAVIPLARSLHNDFKDYYFNFYFPSERS